MELFKMNLHLFDGINKTTDTTATTGNDLSAENKTYYDKRLIRLAKPNLVHGQFGQKRDIPKNGGKTIEFRKYDSLPKALSPLDEGITPSGSKMNVSAVTATVHQYGGFVEISDVLILTAIDNNLNEAVSMIADQAGRTLDTVDREVLNAGSSVQYGAEAVNARFKLVGGDATPANNHYLSIDCINRAVRALKVQNAAKINGEYVGIIHPDVAYDLMNDSRWINVKAYSDPKGIYEGEIGKIGGVRFVESTEAKIFHAADLTVADGTDAGYRKLTVASLSTKTFTVDEKITTKQATALVGRKVIIKGYLYTVSAAAAGAAGAATFTVSETVSGSPTDGEIVYPGEAGAQGRDVYSTIIMGENAYGITEVEGGGLTTIIKQLGSAGTSDPLNQRATCGWKAIHACERLVEQYLVRVETASTYETGAN